MINIVKVASKKQLRDFVDFQNKLYENNPYYVPGLRVDELATLRKDKNPAYDYCEADFFLAYRGKEIVGRVGVIINHRANEKWEQKHARFTCLDMIDDIEVTKALMEAAENWALQHDMTYLQGPMGFTDMDHQGMLIEGFEELDMMITIYNHPYYQKHMEQLGYVKDEDWVEYQIMLPDEPIQKISRISSIIKKKYGFKLVTFDKKKALLPYAHQIFDLINEAYSPLYGTVPLTEKQINYYVKTFFGFLNPDFIKVIVDKNDKLAAFGITMPSLSRALQKSKGKITPISAISLLRAINRNDRLDLMLVAVRPDLQGLGVNAILIESIMEVARDYDINIAETGPELENNTKVQAQWKLFEKRQHRRRRSWIKSL